MTGGDQSHSPGLIYSYSHKMRLKERFIERPGSNAF